MELQVWSKLEDAGAVILALRGDAVHRIKIAGRKEARELPKMIEALREGVDPMDLGARSVDTLSLGSIEKVEVSPEQDHIKFRASGYDGATLKFRTGDADATEIARCVLARAGRGFREGQEDVGALKALFEPMVMGGFFGLCWGLLFDSSNHLVRGEEIEISGGRGRLFHQLMIWVAGVLGETGTLLVGVGMLALTLGWATKRLIRRPQRTAWWSDQAG